MSSWLVTVCLIASSTSIFIGHFLYADLLLISGILSSGEEIDETSICNKLGKFKLGYFNTMYVNVNDKFAVRAKLDNSTVFIKSLPTSEYLRAAYDLKTSSNINLLNHVTKVISDKTSGKLIVCPIPINLPKFFETVNFDFASIYTGINTNPESLILQILKPPQWPVPKFIGSCGRLDIVEDGGKMLTSFYSATWQARVDLSIKLLNAAYEFTFKHPEYAFYLTDPSPDNIAVNSENDVKFIDLGSLIIVDKNPVEKDQDFDSISSYKYEPCENCYKIDPVSICSSKISDFNLLQICQVILGEKSQILRNGLLHDSPNKNITNLIHECVIGRQNRFDVFQNLIQLLKNEI